MFPDTESSLLTVEDRINERVMSGVFLRPGRLPPVFSIAPYHVCRFLMDAGSAGEPYVVLWDPECGRTARGTISAGGSLIGRDLVILCSSPLLLKCRACFYVPASKLA